MRDQLFLLFMVFACICGTLNYKNLLPLYRLFVPFLLVTIGVEIAGFILKKRLINNHLLYSIYTPLAFLFYYYIYYRAIDKKWFRRCIIGWTIFFILVFITNILFIQGSGRFNTYTFSLGAVGLVACTVSYFIQLLNDVPTKRIQFLPLFWISTGALFFYVAEIPFMGLLNYLYHYYPNLTTSYFKAINILNIIMYLLFGIGLLCKTPTRK